MAEDEKNKSKHIPASKRIGERRSVRRPPKQSGTAKVKDYSQAEELETKETADSYTKVDYEVGYGKPPKHGRFKPGHSGNPKGRPKESKGFKTILNDVLSKKVITRSKGKEKKISTREAIVLSLVQKALKGDNTSIREIMHKDEGVELEQIVDVKDTETEEILEDIDLAILAQYERQIKEGLENG